MVFISGGEFTLESLCKAKRRRCKTEASVNLSGKRTEHQKCMFYSLEELILISSFFFCILPYRDNKLSKEKRKC